MYIMYTAYTFRTIKEMNKCITLRPFYHDTCVLHILYIFCLVIIANIPVAKFLLKLCMIPCIYSIFPNTSQTPRHIAINGGHFLLPSLWYCYELHVAVCFIASDFSLTQIIAIKDLALNTLSLTQVATSTQKLPSGLALILQAYLVTSHES